MSWRVAKSLLTLRDQINARYPTRNKLSDGTIGDADHRNRQSDHNPWCGPGVVTALDITHDPGAGVDIDRLTDELQASHDPRIKYVIANRLIMSGNAGPSPWRWRAYSGPNPHTRHFHLSVMCGAAMDNTSPWDLPSLQPKEDDMSAEDVWKEPLVNRVLDDTAQAGTLLSHIHEDTYDLGAAVKKHVADTNARFAKVEAQCAEILALLKEGNQQ